MTLFQRIDWFFNEISSRIGSPTPLFFRVLAGIWGFFFTISVAVLSLNQSMQPNHLPDRLVYWCQIISLVSGTGIVQAFLARKDPPPNPPPP